MMTKKKFVLVVVLVSLISCGETGGKDYTYEELQQGTDEFNPLGTHFWEEFGDLKDKYNLTDTESKMLGAWSGLEKNIARSFYFYPNGLFMVGFGTHKYKNKENRYLAEGYGIWEVRNDKLVVTMYRFQSSSRRTETSGRNLEYFSVTPYEAELININDVDPDGYTRKPFKYFILPAELRSKIDVPSDVREKTVMVRSIYSILVITNSRWPKKDYGYLSIVPEMAAENLSGLDIVTNPALVEKFFSRPFY
jgi:hypothetical protein